MKVKSKMIESKLEKELDFISHLLVEQFAPKYIIHYATVKHRFGRHGVFCETTKVVTQTLYFLIIDFDHNQREHSIQAALDQSLIRSKVIIQAHGENEVRRKLQERNAYFVKIINDGEVLFSAPDSNFLVNWPVSKTKTQLAKAITAWRRYSAMAKGFIAAAEQAVSDNYEQVGLYQLHHATEQICLGLIAVFMAYRPASRKLEKLLHTCACFSDLPVQHFTGTPDHLRMLKTMDIDFDEWKIREAFLKEHSAYRFLDMVNGFLKLAEGICKERFEEMEGEVKQVKLQKEEVHHS